MVRAALVMAMLTLSVLVSVTASHAHEYGKGSALKIAQSSPQPAVSWAMATTILKAAENKIDCCGDGSARSGACSGADSCCNASCALLVAANSSSAPNLFERVEILPRAQIRLASVGPISVRRPPRNIF